MKIIDPKAEFYNETNPLKRIEKIARVCWNTEDKITETSARPFCEKLINMGHMSPFEHARIKVPWCDCSKLVKTETPYGYNYRKSIFCDDRKGDFFQCNARDLLALGGSLEQLETYENADDYATVLFTVDIGISRELCRHRQMSFMERSTRYVNFSSGVEFIRQFPFAGCEKEDDYNYGLWRNNCANCESLYKMIIDLGKTPQEARSVLPLSTATRIYVTGMFNQWHDVVRLRTANGAHPSMQYAMKLMLNNPDCPEQIKIKEEK